MLNSFQRGSTEDIIARINKLGTLGKPQEDFLFANINEWLQSEKRKYMLKAQSYYQNDNDIKDRERYYIDRRGIKQVAKNLSNSRLSHPFMRKLTNQKVNYLLSREPSVQCDNETLGELLTAYINKPFLKMLKNVGTDAIINGVAWLQVYYNKDGELRFKRIPSEEIIPFWADAEHTELDAVIRHYSIMHYLPDGQKKEIIKVEFHTTEGVWYYEMGNRGLKPDTDKESGIQGHFTVVQQGTDADGNPTTQNIQATWEKVPFIAFKYNSSEISLLKWIKPLIDDYDINTSDTSNNLQDIPNSIKVVKNYDGTDKGEFTQNLALYRTAFVSGDGDMKAIETSLDIAVIDSHLNRLRKDIYESGSGVDTQETGLGNASGVALKFRYADLDNDINDMRNEFAAALDEVVWFIKVDLANKGLGDFRDEEVEFIFNTDGIINESEVIADAKNSLGIISDETILANHPWVTDATAELQRARDEKVEKIADMQNAMGGSMNSGFGQPQASESEENE